MASQKFSPWPLLITIVAILAFIVALPNEWKMWAPGFLRPDAHLGLDLAGGTQLDFRISEDELNQRQEKIAAEIEELKKGGSNDVLLSKQNELRSLQEQHRNIVEAIRTVLERRINSLGVSEATITPSYFGSEQHLLVECPGIIDKQKCLATVGKTIQLEFKEQYTGDEQGFAEEMLARANKAFADATAAGGSLKNVGEDLSSQLGISYFDSRVLYATALPKGLEGALNQKPGDGVRKTEGTIQTVQQTDAGSELTEVKGIYLTEVLAPRAPQERPVSDPNEALQTLAEQTAGATAKVESSVLLASLPSDVQATAKTTEIGSLTLVTRGDGTPSLFYLGGRTEGNEEMTASHVLVQYQGSLRADAGVTRTKEEARTRAAALLARIAAGEPFESIARIESDGASKASAGSLGVIKRGVMGDTFDAVAFLLSKGQLSSVVETPFGFHIIRADTAAAVSGAEVSYALLSLPVGTDAEALKKKVEASEVVRSDEAVTVRSMFFSLTPTGWKDTALNGQHFRSASVTVDPTTNIPVVQIQFSEEGGKLFQELTKTNIGKPIAIFVGGEMVSAPVVQGEIIGGTAVITGSRSFEEARLLAQDLNTGAIPAPIYLAGQTTVEATLGAEALKQSIYAAGIGLLLLALFIFVIYRTLGFIANITLAFYVVLLIAAMKLPLFLVTQQYVVLTLAGIAGMILSMGMAVDANVLIFERIKEELKKGKLMKTAVETGFKRAWPSIRDGNFSTLITCAILFSIGTSIIKGFSITLTVGIIISMFTAVVVSRWMCRKFAVSPLGEKMALPSQSINGQHSSREV